MVVNDRTPQIPPLIAPVSPGEDRPLWSVMIPAYNCTGYLRQALQSVLKQDPGPAAMQIEVIDDCSTDGDVAALVKEIGQGRVGFLRQPENKGSLRNFETCLNRSRGKWIHLLHGDDLVKPGFYKEIENLLTQYPEAGAAFTGFYFIDDKGEELFSNHDLLSEPGIIDNWLLKIACANEVQPPAIVVKRSVYEKLGSFFAVHYGEDWEMWVRIAAHYPVAYSPRCLASYRLHTTNISTRSLRSGQNIKDILKVIDIIQQYLPEEKRKELKDSSAKHFSIYFAKKSHDMYDSRENSRAALLQAWGAVKMHQNRTTLYWVLRLYMKYLTGGGF